MLKNQKYLIKKNLLLHDGIVNDEIKKVIIGKIR